MNKMWVIFEREYLERVKKKSFVIATLLVPLILPAIAGLAIWLTSLDSGEERIVYVIDESGLYQDGFDINGYTIYVEDIPLDSARDELKYDEIFGILYIPKLDINNTSGITFESKKNPEITFTNKFRGPIREKIDSLKLIEYQLDPEIVAKLKTNIRIESKTMTDDGESKDSNREISFFLGYAMAFLMYMFVVVYGNFIMQSVLNEKTSKIVEVIVSSVKPFQLMLGKVLANAAVAFTQFGIWIVLMLTITTVFSAIVGFDPSASSSPEVNEIIQEAAKNKDFQQESQKYLEKLYAIPWASIIGLFLFYFLGGFLLFGALFAAVGSAVDSIQEASQFVLPITIPIIASIMLMGVVLQNPDGNISTILTIIPFTSPVLMMARIPYGIPEAWEVALSMIMLVAGFIGTLWVAGRIYRVGILMHGAKVSYKVLIKWFMTKQ
ncbi:MAG: ABC transporter permease [Bacteroidota bacterium]